VAAYPCSQKRTYAALAIRRRVASARWRRDSLVGSGLLTAVIAKELWR
jgi:hypothetical protein